MSERLITISVVAFGEAERRTHVPAIVANWNEEEDGQLENMLGSCRLLLALGL